MNCKQVVVLDIRKQVFQRLLALNLQTRLVSYDQSKIYSCSYSAKTFEFIVKDGSMKNKQYTFETEMVHDFGYYLYFKRAMKLIR